MSDRYTNFATAATVAVALAVLGAPGGAANTWYHRWQEGRVSRAAFARNRAALLSTGQWLGGVDSSTFIVEFSDYECPFCRLSAPIVSKLIDAGTAPAIIYVNMPLPAHAVARPAAAASICADLQGKGREMHRILMETQEWQSTKDWNDLAKRVAVPDLATFSTCLTSPQTDLRIEEGLALGDSLGVRGTPTFLGPGGSHTGTPTESVLGKVRGR